MSDNADSFSDETITVTVLRSSDASKTEIDLPWNHTLDHLKLAISSSSLGPLQPSYQRLFHLGRELKSGHRSLQKLGVGKFQVFTVHLHSTQPAALELSAGDDDDDEVIEVGQSSPTRKRTACTGIIDLLDDSDDDDDDQVQDDKRQRISPS